MKYSKYSVVIVGSGIAGLYLAYKLSCAKNYKDGILLITKSGLNESNSRLAQGGIVAVLPENKLDSTSLHVSDTIKSGCGLSDFNVVKFISENSAKVIEDLLKIGVEFDKNERNRLNFTIEAAHSIPRVLHAGGDCTGKVIESRLCELISKCDSITIYEETLAVELLCDQNGECKGILTYNSKNDSYEAIYSNATVLATGGAGQVYKYTTNPGVATGDGLALAINAGAKIRDMEFIQFHPSALDVPHCGASSDCGGGKMSLISEAVRGEGAVVVDETGECFVKKYDERGSLAPRDVLSRAIYMHMQEKQDQSDGAKIYLDISKIGMEKFKARFPGITEICENSGVDLAKMLIPIAPSAHYCMGGISTQVNGTTSIKGLYAIGEVACTGLHGANRLASNSLLECVVSAYELAKLLGKSELDAPRMIDEAAKATVDAYSCDIDYEIEVDVAALTSKIKNVMWNNAGILRSEKGLSNALFELNEIEKTLGLPEGVRRKRLNREQYELRNMLAVARAIVIAALERKIGIGAHYRSDDALFTDDSAFGIDLEINNGGGVFA